jgi:plasmid stability protein
MKNITLKIDDETYRKARIHAAHEGTSVSMLVRDFLGSLASDREAETQQGIVAALQEIYAEADARATRRNKPLRPLTREEIYAERLR